MSVRVGDKAVSRVILGGLDQKIMVGAVLVHSGVPFGFSLWKTNTQIWRFGTQRVISPVRT